MADDNFFQTEIIKINDVDEEGNFNFKAADNQIGYLFEDEHGQPVEHMTAYHRLGTGTVELSHQNPGSVTSVAHLHPVITFPNDEIASQYIANKHVQYRTHNGQDDDAGLLRMIHIGTHLPVFVHHVQMQEERNSFLELTHCDQRFNVRCRITNPRDGKALRDVYRSTDQLKFTWIKAGGHGKAGDATTE
eukprot:gene6017-6627_t